MIICISGLSGAGKSTVATYLINHLNELNLPVFHINSDIVANKILVKKYGFNTERDVDYEKDELDIIYSSMFEFIRHTIRLNPEAIIITDGMYRKNSQRILLEVVAKQLDVPFHFIKVEANTKIAKKRLEQRFKDEGFGGRVEASKYEEVRREGIIIIKNNNNISTLKNNTNKLLARIHSIYK